MQSLAEHRLVISGIGVTTAAGVGKPAFAQSLREGRSAFGQLTRPGRENARETVDGATPAALATS